MLQIACGQRSDVPDSVIDKIAAEMDAMSMADSANTVKTPTHCKTEMLTPINEFQKLLDAGYRPIDKVCGHWTNINKKVGDDHE
jgi:hypothetical protein